MDNHKAKVYAADGTLIDGESYLWQLQYMSYDGNPLFVGTLEDDNWKHHEDLVNGIENGWMEIVPDEGFIITEKGRDVLREHGLHLSRHLFETYGEKRDHKKQLAEYREQRERWKREEEEEKKKLK